MLLTNAIQYNHRNCSCVVGGSDTSYLLDLFSRIYWFVAKGANVRQSSRVFGSVLVQDWLENSEVLRFLKKVYVKKGNNNASVLKGTHFSLLLRRICWLINGNCATGYFQDAFYVYFKTGRRVKHFLWKWLRLLADERTKSHFGTKAKAGKSEFTFPANHLFGNVLSNISRTRRWSFSGVNGYLWIDCRLYFIHISSRNLFQLTILNYQSQHAMPARHQDEVRYVARLTLMFPWRNRLSTQRY